MLYITHEPASSYSATAALNNTNKEIYSINSLKRLYCHGVNLLLNP